MSWPRRVPGTVKVRYGSGALGTAAALLWLCVPLDKATHAGGRAILDRRQ